MRSGTVAERVLLDLLARRDAEQSLLKKPLERRPLERFKQSETPLRVWNATLIKSDEA